MRKKNEYNRMLSKILKEILKERNIKSKRYLLNL